MEAARSDTQKARWAKASEVAEHTGFSTAHLARLRMMAGGPPFSKLGRGKQAQVRYCLADVEAWMRAHVRSSTSDAGIVG